MDVRLRINHAGTVLCEPAWRWDPKPAMMTDFDLWFVWAGVGTFAVDGIDSPIHRGKVFVLRPGGSYRGRHDRQRRLGVCFIHFDFLDARGRVIKPAEKDLPPLQFDVRDPDQYERLLRRIVDLRERGAPDAANRLLESVLLAQPLDQLDDAVPIERRQREARIADVMRHIRENPGELYSVEQLAERAMYAVDHFSKLFTEIAGVSPKEFCIRTRLARAQHLLTSTDLSMTEIASALGYGDVFFFSRQFKTRTGQSPTQYRRAFSGR